MIQDVATINYGFVGTVVDLRHLLYSSRGYQIWAGLLLSISDD